MTPKIQSTYERIAELRDALEPVVAAELEAGRNARSVDGIQTARTNVGALRVALSEVFYTVAAAENELAQRLTEMRSR
ncbi:MAG TPA: hypothetical protein VM925_33445 [Labilithrix sp.]|nr:hypothetical protein [Labilithrix sp.]